MTIRPAAVVLTLFASLAPWLPWGPVSAYGQSGTPGAPAIGFAEPVNPPGSVSVGRAVRVSFRPPSNAAATGVTGYSATAAPVDGGPAVTVPGSRSPIIITGLSNDSSYTITVRARNAAGLGAASAPSNRVYPSSSAIPALDPAVTWVLPTNPKLLGASPSQFSVVVNDLRSRIGNNQSLTRVKVGVSTFVGLAINDFDVDSRTPKEQLRANMSAALDTIDLAIRQARPHNLPIGISLITMMVRDRSLSGGDPGLQEARDQDRRNMQWYSDQTSAPGWMTYSAYARRLRRVQELYIREFGRAIAEKMQANPGILVAITGDGESEMTYAKFRDLTNPGNPADRRWADYSPFAVLEFRDWLTGRGLYATGGPLSGDAYQQAARYTADPSPSVDGNGDGHTLNGDFGTVFSSWDLRYFNWSLSDAETAGAIAGGTSVPFPGGSPDGFDPPRTYQPGNPWFDAWNYFRQSMLRRYNRDFARWVTESSNPELGGIPTDRWYSAQVPADFLFGNPPPDSGVRHFTSGSAHWTADVWPFGSNGVTGYTANPTGCTFLPSGACQPNGANGPYYRTVQHVAPRMAALSQRWGIVEWNPSDPYSTDRAVYDEEMNLLLAYRPSLLMPYRMVADNGVDDEPHWRVYNSGFEPALKNFIERLESGEGGGGGGGGGVGAPGAPTGFAATVTGASLGLTWGAPATGAPVARYLLEAAIDSTFASVVYGPASLGSATSSTIPVGGVTGTYYLRIRAENASGTGPASNTQSITLGAAGCSAAPPAPASFTITKTGPGLVALNWGGSAGATAYRLQAATDSGFATVVLDQDVGAVTGLGAAGPPGTYWVRVFARNLCGTGPASNVASVTLP